MLPFPKLLNTSRLPVLSGYDQFVKQAQKELTSGSAHLAVKTQNLTGSAPYFTNNNIPIRVYLNFEIVTGTVMWGSSYNSRFSWDSSFYRIAQHCFPTIDIYRNYLDNKLMCMIEYSAYENNPAIDGVLRNEYQSANVKAQPGNRCIKFVYYDAALEQMMVYNPSIANTPEPY